jgi:hypothetical protein
MAGVPTQAASQDDSTPPVSQCDLSLQIAKLQADVDWLRRTTAELIARDQREAQARELRAAWVRGMKDKQANLRVGRIATIMTGAAIVTTGLAILMVRSDYQTGPIIATTLSGALATGAAIQLGKVVSKRRAIEREIRALPESARRHP